MTLLEIVKKNLRVTHAALDEAEIMPLIEAAKQELENAGAVKTDDDDPMIIRAVTAYAKAHFGYDNPEADRFGRAFESIRNTLSMLEDYNAAPEGRSG
jgi:hypothetical protein